MPGFTLSRRNAVVAVDCMLGTELLLSRLFRPPAGDETASPAVAPTTAVETIVARRQEHGPFTSVDQFGAISGIGPKRLDTLRGLVVP